eukprot:scaffold97818_cov16-Tisochrysis_lutea.AAC.3
MPDAWLGCLLWQGMQAPLLPEGPGAVAHAWEEGEAGLTRSQPPPWQPQSWSCLRRSSVPGLAAAAARSLGMRASVQRIAAAWRQCSPRPAPGLDAPARCGWQVHPQSRSPPRQGGHAICAALLGPPHSLTF